MLLLIAFFIWEARIEDIDAAMYVPYSSFHLSTVLTVFLRSPPSLWRHPNVPVLVAAALVPTQSPQLTQRQAAALQFGANAFVHMVNVALLVFIFSAANPRATSRLGHSTALRS